MFVMMPVFECVPIAMTTDGTAPNGDLLLSIKNSHRKFTQPVSLTPFWPVVKMYAAAEFPSKIGNYLSDSGSKTT